MQKLTSGIHSKCFTVRAFGDGWIFFLYNKEVCCVASEENSGLKQIALKHCMTWRGAGIFLDLTAIGERLTGDWRANCKGRGYFERQLDPLGLHCYFS